jgi:hypothetical protein
MNGEQWTQLDARLREIEQTYAALDQKMEDDDEWKEKISEFVDEIRIELATKRGAEEEIAKNASWVGGKSGGIVGGIVSGIIIGAKAIFFSS